MYIRMKESRRGSEDGFTVSQYHAGDIYEVRDMLARSFIADESAEEVQGEAGHQPETLESFVGTFVKGLSRANADFDRIFRPGPTRGTAPTNPATLAVKGDL